MKGLWKKLEETILYFGSQDERLQRAADKAGHWTAWFLFLALAVDVVARVRIGGQSWEQISLEFWLVLLAAVFWLVQWIYRGITFLDSQTQIRLFRGAMLVTTVGVALTVWLTRGEARGWVVKLLGPQAGDGLALAISLGLGVVAGLVAWVILRLTQVLAKRRNERQERVD